MRRRWVLILLAVTATVLGSLTTATVAAAATVTAMSPTSGPLGTAVTITGTGFAGASSVRFTGATATGFVVSPTKINTFVPAGASTGPVTVTSGGSTAVAAGTFTVTVGLLLATKIGPPGSRASLSGSGFAANEAVDVYADTTDVALAATSATGTFTLPRFTIPASAPPGDFWVSAVGRTSGRAAQVAFTVRADWPMMGFDAAGSRSNPTENVITPASARTLARAFTYRAGGGVQSGVSVAAGVAYVQASDGFVHAFDATTGAARWKSPTDNATLFSTPAVSGATVVVGSSDGKVYAFNALTGAARWSYTTVNGFYASPTITGGVVYIVNFAGALLALDLATGALRWAATVAGGAVSTPAVDDGLVFVGAYDSKVYALDATTGAIVWSYTTSGVVEGPPTVANGTVYVGNDAGTFYALSAATGTLTWSADRGAALYGRPAVSDGVVYVGRSGGGVIAADADSGAVLWTASTGGTNATGPAVAGGVLFISSYDRKVWAFDAATGAKLWSYALGGGTFGDPPSVVNGVVYQASESGRVFAFAPRGQVPSAARSVAPARGSLHPDPALRVD